MRAISAFFTPQTQGVTQLSPLSAHLNMQAIHQAYSHPPSEVQSDPEKEISCTLIKSTSATANIASDSTTERLYKGT